MRRSALTIYAFALTLGWSGCMASQGLSTGTLKALEGQGKVSTLVPVERLELPLEAELFIAPVAWIGAKSLARSSPRRLQIVVRALREDGGVHQWFLGTDGRATEGERGFQLRPEERTRTRFGGADYGPLRVASLEALEFAVAEVPVEPVQGPGFVGLARLRGLGSAAGQGGDVMQTDVVRPLLAKRLELITFTGASPGVQTWRFVFVGGATGVEPQISRLHRLDRQALLDAKGMAVEDVNALVLDLQLTIPEHR